MAISTFGTLKSAVADWLNRADLSAVIPTFVQLAELNLRRDIKCRAMEQTASGTLSAVTLALPTRFIEARRVVLGTYVQTYMTPNEWHKYRDETSDRYTIIGESFHFQSSSADYDISYWQAFAAFSDDGDTNWLITNHPDVYLWATLEQAGIYTQDDRLIALSRGLYEKAKIRINTTEQQARYGGPLFVRPQQAV
jgi:hypothetical protein